MDDPEWPKNSELRRLNITREEFEHAYYDPIRTIVASRGSAVQSLVTGKRIREARIDEADLWIGLAEQDALTGKSEVASSTSDLYLGKDGISIRLGSSWNQESMSLQPHMRSH